MDDWKTSLVLSDLQAACNALGGWDESVYVREKDCAESLKDLLRYLRRDDESFAIRRALGKINVLKTDLLPLIRFYHKDSEVFEITTKLIVNLTTPVVLLYKEEIPIEKNARNIYMTLEATLCTYKEAFLEKEVWSVLAERLEELMNLNYHERSEEDTETITRILTMLRNVLHPINKEELQIKTHGDVSSHDRLLWALHLAGMDDLIIFMCAARMDQSHTLFVLEILRLMLREQEASVLASTGTQRPQEELQKDADELMKLREIEKKKKKVALRGALQNRFSRFSSTYQVRNVKSLGDDTQELIVVGDPAKVLQSINNMDFDQKKKFRARAKNRRPEESTSIKRRTTLNIRLFLKEFCSDLLNSAFNALHPQVKRAIARAGDTGDEGHYFWLLDFFLEFNRLTGFDIALVSEAISKETFHFVQTQMEKCHEMMVSDKRRIHLWMKRLHVDLKTFHQLLMTVSAMSNHNDVQVRAAARVLQQHLFYLPEYRDIVLHLLLNFNENVAPVGYLRDLAATVHCYLRMLQGYCESGKLKVKDLKAKTKTQKRRLPPISDFSEEELNDKWLELSQQLTAVLESEEGAPDCDIEAALEGFLQYEKAFQVRVCKNKIADVLRAGEASEAVGLLRACRSRFADEECFGETEISAESEFLLLKGFFYADGFASVDTMDDEQPDHGEDETDRMQDFDFEDFLKRFVNPKVIKVYGLLLSHYNSNSTAVNKMCVKMLHRIAFDLKMAAMFFQAQIFAVFDRILEDYAITPDIKDLKELARFAKYIINQFVDVAKTNDLALVELLFWKTSVEAYQIQYGYNETEKAKTKAWTEEEEVELKELFEAKNEVVQPGEDVIELIQKDFSNQNRSRRQIITHLRVMGILAKGTRLKSSGTSSNQPWTGEEEQELQELYQNFATSIDPLTQIMMNMTVKRPKFRVIEKLLELGIIHDRSEVRKRRVKKNGEVVIPRRSGKSSRGENDPSCISKEFISSSDDDSSSEDERRDLDGERASEMLRENSQFLEGMRSGRSGSGRSGGSRRARPTKRVVRRIEKVADPEELKALLSGTVQQRPEALDWLVESLEDALSDWKDSGNEAVPLVPLAASEHDSLKDDGFCKLLSTFGLVPPQEGIEQYWRIGGNLTRAMLQSRLDVLRNAKAGQYETGLVDTLEEEQEEAQSDQSDVSGSEQSSQEDEGSEIGEDLAESAGDRNDRTMTEDSESDGTGEGHGDEEGSEVGKETKRSKTKKSTKGLRLSEFVQDANEDEAENEVHEDSADNNEDIGSGTKRRYSNSGESPEKKVKKRKVVLAQSDDESDGAEGDAPMETTPEERPQANEDPSSPEAADETGEKSVKKKRAVIESDDED